MSQQKSARREPLNLRIRPDERGLIDRAARIAGKSRTDFMLEASRRAAEEALLDQTLWLVDPDAHARFLALLDAPPNPNDRLRRTMQAVSPWE